MQMSGKASEVAAPAADPGDGEGNMLGTGLAPNPRNRREVVMMDSRLAQYFDKKAKALGIEGLLIEEGEAEAPRPMAAGEVQEPRGARQGGGEEEPPLAPREPLRVCHHTQYRVLLVKTHVIYQLYYFLQHLLTI